MKLIPISANIISHLNKKRFNSPIKIVYSGSYAKKDAVEQLIDAFENVYKTNKNIKLYLTGMGVAENIKTIINKISNKPGIVYLGYIEDEAFYEFLKGADILCMLRTGSKFANAGFPFKLG